jgi:hypothetical protein
MKRKNVVSPDSKLWIGHPATPSQQTLPFAHGGDSAGSKPLTQADLVLSLLRQARASGTPLPLPRLLQVGVAQHGARLNELRKKGFQIANTMWRDHGIVCSEYVLVFDPERDHK